VTRRPPLDKAEPQKTISEEQARSQYERLEGIYARFCAEIRQQLETLLGEAGASLATPIQTRVKTFASILQKLQRQRAVLGDLSDMHDIAGTRIITLFRRDAEAVKKIIRESFEVLHEEDTMGRLQEDQFGYGSVHFEVRLKDAWLELPTFKGFRGLIAEIQVRTAPQHIWAASSHVLQYKKEEHVPPSVRRSIHRVAALLETVDLEFERVLGERQEYDQELIARPSNERLNTDSLRNVLDSELPPTNRSDDEDYAHLLDELSELDVMTEAQLRDILTRQKPKVMFGEARSVAQGKGEVKGGKPLSRASQARKEKGVFFTHVGLTRTALSLEFGMEVLREVMKRVGARGR
jgi:putative GTP pyrophosphokinase